jgi:exosortase O
MKIPLAPRTESTPWFSEQALRLTGNLILGFLWLWLYRPVYPYLGVIFTGQEFRTNQIILLGVIALIAMQVRRGDLRPCFDAAPQLYLPAILLALGGSAGYLLLERFLDINTISASLFGLASYGFLGLWLRPSRWRQGLPAALLLVGALPFGDHLQTFVGYPLRIATAAVVQQGLAAMGVHTLGIDTILVFENGIAQVDLPCSGIKSLWTGGLFLLAATWIERRPVNLRWLVISALFAGLLLAANLLRVGVLVGVGQVLGWRLLAEMLHVPLGVLGFIGACAAAVWMLRWTGFLPDPEATGVADSGEPARAESTLIPDPARPAWLPPSLALVLIGLSLLYTPPPPAAAAPPLPAWDFPLELNVSPWPFTPGEQRWLSRDGPQSADRWTFEWRGHTGSLLFITSNTWRAHHRPERCFEVYGMSVSNSHSFLNAPDFPIRSVTLGSGPQRELYTAVYWLQSSQRVTDDYASRIWADFEPGHRPWVLVTVLFDQPYDPEDANLAAFYQALKHTVQRSLNGGDTP